MKFGVKNLRRLRDVPSIDIKPITLLVGRNSSGKSSFLRMFPLLRQSLMTRTSSPILWYGDLVDFGTYSTAVSHPAVGQEIQFSFGLDEVTTEPEFFWADHGPYETPSVVFRDVTLEIVIEPTEMVGPIESTRTMVSKIRIRSSLPEFVFDMILDSDAKVVSLLMNGVEVLHYLHPNQLQISPGTILPDLFFIVPESDKRTVSRRRRGDGEFSRLLLDLTGDEKDETLFDGAFRLVASRASSSEEMRKVAAQTNNPVWIELIERATSDESSALFKRLKTVIAVSTMAEVVNKFNQHLRQVLTNVLYIGPARARSERYYRYQDLSVSEIDPDGKNFPMFLNSLAEWQVRRLSDWIESLFNYGIEVKRDGGHISINLTSKGNVSNIVDTGYGVSQILPVLGQIWWARSRPQTAASRRSKVSLLAIEQPELHLHPAHQALLADALVGEVGLSPEKRVGLDQRIHFIVETHSETLVNRLGELISVGRLNHKDVQIIMFEPDGIGDHTTSIRTSSFNQAGEIEDWPYGFFQAAALK